MYLLAKNRLRYSRERASQSLKVIQLIFPMHSSGTQRLQSARERGEAPVERPRRAQGDRRGGARGDPLPGLLPVRHGGAGRREAHRAHHRCGHSLS